MFFNPFSKYLFPLVVLTAVACTEPGVGYVPDDEEQEEPTEEFVETLSDFLPLQVGNIWTYSESMQSSDINGGSMSESGELTASIVAQSQTVDSLGCVLARSFTFVESFTGERHTRQDRWDPTLGRYVPDRRDTLQVEQAGVFVLFETKYGIAVREREGDTRLASRFDNRFPRWEDTDEDVVEVREGGNAWSEWEIEEGVGIVRFRSGWVGGSGNSSGSMTLLDSLIRDEPTPRVRDC